MFINVLYVPFLKWTLGRIFTRILKFIHWARKKRILKISEQLLYRFKKKDVNQVASFISLNDHKLFMSLKQYLPTKKGSFQKFQLRKWKYMNFEYFGFDELPIKHLFCSREKILNREFLFFSLKFKHFENHLRENFITTHSTLKALFLF